MGFSVWGLDGGQSNRGQGSGARTVDYLVTASNGDTSNLSSCFKLKREIVFYGSGLCVSSSGF